jgi:hypothetical protein
MEIVSESDERRYVTDWYAISMTGFLSSLRDWSGFTVTGT